jgi:hypothetical protein
LNATADRGRWHAQSQGGPDKASGSDYLNEEIDFVQVKHSFLTNMVEISPSWRSSGSGESGLSYLPDG